jgi:hypothetical protein
VSARGAAQSGDEMPPQREDEIDPPLRWFGPYAECHLERALVLLDHGRIEGRPRCPLAGDTMH